MPHVVFVFLDGVGLGPADTERNPFARFVLPAFARLAKGHPWTDALPTHHTATHVVRRIDATLGVEGLPQSGTGQAALFTGVNCAQLAGRHYGPFPHSKTKPVLDDWNLFHQVQALRNGAPDVCAFANAYPPRFFSYAEQRDRWTVTTRCCVAAGVTIRGLAALERGEALTADLTGAGWHRLDLPVETIDEAEAGDRLHRLSRRYPFTLFEYFFTDKAGHSRSFDRAETVLRALDRFFERLYDCLDPERDLLLITSDHGNLEDLSTKSHTRNPVPLVAYGTGAYTFQTVRDLTDVAPAIVRAVSPDGLAP